MNIRILQPLISGIPHVLGLGTRMSDPHVFVVFWAPKLYPNLTQPRGPKTIQPKPAANSTTRLLSGVLFTFLVSGIPLYDHYGRKVCMHFSPGVTEQPGLRTGASAAASRSGFRAFAAEGTLRPFSFGSCEKCLGSPKDQWENSKLVRLPYWVLMKSLSFLFLGGWRTETMYHVQAPMIHNTSLWEPQ